MINFNIKKAAFPVILALLSTGLLTGCGKKKEEASSEVAGTAIVQSESLHSDAADGAGTATSEVAGTAIVQSESLRTDAADGAGSEAGEKQEPAEGGLLEPTVLTEAGASESNALSETAGLPESGTLSERTELPETGALSETVELPESGALSEIAELSESGALFESDAFSESASMSEAEDVVSGFIFSLGGTINSTEDGIFQDTTSGTSGVAGGAIVPGLGGKIGFTPMEKNELSQYIGMSFAELEKRFPEMESETAVGMRSYKLGEGSGDRTHQVGLTGSESGGVITKINLYLGEEYKIAGITSGMDLTAADKAAKNAGFEPEGETTSGLITYRAADGVLTVVVYSSDGVTVNTVSCET